MKRKEKGLRRGAELTEVRGEEEKADPSASLGMTDFGARDYKLWGAGTESFGGGRGL